ncbi:TetR/AcrR family transcriptional regulator [Salicibibacter kimchii]|uniref:TetR/AcrR family transcriptional regulator n=1 Tax=Salicibibacter kimchii TaxID=2099786 RepID=A0A345C2M0_9BACI|nr:TetR/AcrR family transcriptional regulator [Salicibibacter kimchii]AXF57451.1 TetR/AcrR family transcriptional regulator [Salicibibacter kimchii]
MNKKLDRRKKYTRMVLKDSLISLLQTKQLATITVKEICKSADINRTTFYTHYKDPFDLLEKIEEEIIADLNTYLNQYNIEQEEESLQMTERLLAYIASKYNICQTLLNENGDHSFEQRVMDVARTFLINNWTDNNEMGTDVSEYAGTFLIGGSIYVIKQWLANNMDQSPEQIARLINSAKIR